MWILQSRGETPQIIRLAPGTVRTVGRTGPADFIVDAPLVSRLHCKLTADASNQLVIEDVGSTNGIIVNGVLLPRAVLRAGDVVTIGRVEFSVDQTD